MAFRIPGINNLFVPLVAVALCFNQRIIHAQISSLSYISTNPRKTYKDFVSLKYIEIKEKINITGKQLSEKILWWVILVGMLFSHIDTDSKHKQEFTYKHVRSEQLCWSWREGQDWTCQLLKETGRRREACPVPARQIWLKVCYQWR